MLNIPAGWKLVAVNEAFDDLMFWLDRCHDKGHLDNCYDLVAPWEAFEYGPAPAFPLSVAAASAQDERQAFEAWHKREFGSYVPGLTIHYNRWLGWEGRASVAAPAAGDALDAARYRWLRHEGREEKHQDDGAIYVRQVQLTSGVITGSAVLVEEDLDAAIDSALAAQVPQQGEA